MATKRNSRRASKVGVAQLGKPRGVIQARVQAVGPERFGVTVVDPHKTSSKWMLCDFYGQVLLPPRVVEHGQAQLKLATQELREACERHRLQDHIVAVEMTGVYHKPVQRAFRAAGSETRLVHPFATNQYRQAASPDVKTDDRDLEAIFRAAVNGFGLLEPLPDETYSRLQILVRHRRDLVKKRSKLQCQIREYLNRCLPGYGSLFDDDSLWRPATAFLIAQRGGSAAAIRAAGGHRPEGGPGIKRWLKEAKVRCWDRTVERVFTWSGNAADADPRAAEYARVWQDLYEDWQAKTKRIVRLEQELAEILVKTPYLLLLSHPGINVVSAADLAGEMGPIQHYAHARAITGRAGIFPSRYQSGQVDCSAGPLARLRNAQLRGAVLRMADNLILCNAHYRGKAQLWKEHGADARDIRCRVANRALRSVFQIVSGRQLYAHPSRLDRDYILGKLLAFHDLHQTPPHEIVRDLAAAAEQIPAGEHAAEGAVVRERYDESSRSRASAAKELRPLLVAVLARYGITALESKGEAQGPTRVGSGKST